MLLSFWVFLLLFEYLHTWRKDSLREENMEKAKIVCIQWIDQEKYEKVHTTYFEKADCFLLVFLR